MCRFGLEAQRVPISLSDVDVYLDTKETKCWIHQTSLMTLSSIYGKI